MKIVVFIQNRDFFGTRLLHLPFLDALARQGRHHQVIVFSPYAAGMFYADIGLVQQVCIYRPGVARMWQSLRRIRPDIIISLRPASLWLNVAIALSRAPVRVGYAALGSQALFTATVARNTKIYRALNYRNLFVLAGVEVKLETYFNEQACLSPQQLPMDKTLFCLMPGGGAGDFKRWGIDNFIALCERLVDKFTGAGFIFILGPDERDCVGRIQQSSVGPMSIVLLNETIPVCAHAVANCRAAIANDCGPVHIAQMMEMPLVEIFSDHDGHAAERIREWFYPRQNAVAVTGEPRQDIKRITVDRVMHALTQVLATSKGADERIIHAEARAVKSTD